MPSSAICSADACTSATPLQRFAVTVTPPAGSVGGRIVRYTVQGGHPIDHAIEAHWRHGLLCHVDVQPMAPAPAEVLDDLSQQVAGGAE